MYALAGTLRGTHLASSCLNPRPHFQSLPLVSITVYGYLNALTLVWDETLPDAAMPRETDAQTNCAAVCFETHGDSSFHGPCRWLVRENSRSAGCNCRTLCATASSVRPLPHQRRERERWHAAFPAERPIDRSATNDPPSEYRPWARVVPRLDQRQSEQDLVVSRHQYGNRSSRAVHYRQTKRALSVPSFFAATPLSRRATAHRRSLRGGANDFTPPFGIRWQFAPTPLWNRHVHDRPAAGDIEVPRGCRDCHRRYDRSWSRLRVPPCRAAANQRCEIGRIRPGRRVPKRRAVRARLPPA